MFKSLLRIILILVAVGVLLFFFAPRIFNSAANSLIHSVDSSAKNAQGLAQFIPADATSQGTSGDLQVNLSGLLPRTSYEITLDESQCGLVNKDLGKATSDGSGNFYIELPLSSLDTNQTWFVDIHQQGAEGVSVACGQLQTNQNAVNNSQSGPNLFGAPPSLPNDQGTPTPGATGPSTPNGLPNTGANPGNGQQYQNNGYPRKY